MLFRLASQVWYRAFKFKTFAVHKAFKIKTNVQALRHSLK